MTKKIIFDGDGTLYDSGRSIKNACNHTLKVLGYPTYRDDELDFFVGPPLKESFRLCKVKDDDLDEAVRMYRQYQKEHTLFDIDLYPGIMEMLAETRKRSYEVFLATSRPRKLAALLLDHKGLTRFFGGIFGAGDDGSDAEKEKVVGKVYFNTPRTDVTYMVGDTYMDVLAGKKFYFQTIGCLYGYGNETELRESMPDHLINKPVELLSIVK